MSDSINLRRISACNTHHKFKSQISIDGGRKSLGYFLDVEKAYAVYKTAKEAEAYRWYERLKAGEFVVDERVIERMRTWTLEED